MQARIYTTVNIPLLLFMLRTERMLVHLLFNNVEV